MVSDNLKNYLKNIAIYGFVFLVAFLVILFVNLFVLKLGTPIKNINYAMILEDNVYSKNLSLPLPNIYGISTSQFDPASEFYMNNFDKPISEFHEILNQHYVYEEGTYDCKYWSYVWTLYWKSNYYKYDWDIEYLSTENHIFVMFSNSSGYIIADENNLNCKGNMGC